jgi:hypothetical protein
MFARVAALMFLLMWALAPRVARACAPENTSLFEQLDRAQYVAVGRVSGRSLRAAEVFVGEGRAARIQEQRRQACPVAIQRSHRALFILDADGNFVADQASYIVDPSDALLALVRGYAGVNAAARRAVLIRGIIDGTPQAESAALYLATHPAIIDATTPDERAQLVGAIRSAPAPLLEPLALVFARLHERAAVAPLVARVFDTDRPERIAMLLEIATAHRVELGGHDAPFESDRWVRWRRRQAELSSDFDPYAWIMSYWTAWLLRNEPMELSAEASTPANLAAAMRTGATAMTRILALERCERVRAQTIGENFTRWAFGVAPQRWESFAVACEALDAE